jgi:ketosteroid isomerase-like protein
MRRFVLAAVAVSVFAACQPSTAALTEEQKATIADTIRNLSAEMWATLDPVDYDRMMSYMHPDPESYFVGESAYWVNMLTVYANPSQVREVWDPIMTRHRTQETVPSNEYVAVLAENLALSVTEGTYTITDTLGTTTEPNHFSATVVWVRHGAEWKALHIHQSWNPTN